MRAILCKEYGPPESLVVEDVPTPAITDHQVLVEVKACGVNFPDLLIIENKYQFKPPLPFAPGGEISGVVKEVGAQVKHVKAGDRVLGTPGFGGFAEEVALDARNVVPIPDAMSFDEAAAFLFTYGTSHYALKDRAALKPGETLLVLGAAGGVGLAAVELGKAMGAKVIAAASSAEKIAVCREHGADEGIDYGREDLKDRIKALTGGQGVDVIYDPVGGDFSEAAFRGIAWNGRFLVIGFAAGPIPKIPLNLVLLKGAQIVGVFWGSFTARDPEGHRANIAELMRWYTEGKLKPRISARYSFEQVAAALADLAGRRVKGKVLLVP
jgi:NADPH2:quinone reductase